MRVGFAIAGVGAACALGVVGSHTTLTLHHSRQEMFAAAAEAARGAGVDAIIRNEGGYWTLEEALAAANPPLFQGSVDNSLPLLPIADTLPPPLDFPTPDPLRRLDAGFGAPAFGGIAGAKGASPVAPPPPPGTPEGEQKANFTPPTTNLVTPAFAQPPPPAPDPPPVDKPPPDTPTPVVVVITPPAPPPPSPPPPVANPVRLAAVTEPAPAPEPDTWAMMIIGFAAIGAVVRRRMSSPGGRAVRIAAPASAGKGA